MKVKKKNGNSLDSSHIWQSRFELFNSEISLVLAIFHQIENGFVFVLFLFKDEKGKLGMERDVIEVTLYGANGSIFVRSL